jgi:hypothetical protein
MSKFLFTETSHWVCERHVFVDVEPANAEPEGFEAVAGGVRAGGRVRKYELLSEDGKQKALVSYREQLQAVPNRRGRTGGGDQAC